MLFLLYPHRDDILEVVEYNTNEEPPETAYRSAFFSYDGMQSHNKRNDKRSFEKFIILSLKAPTSSITGSSSHYSKVNRTNSYRPWWLRTIHNNVTILYVTDVINPGIYREIIGKDLRYPDTTKREPTAR